MDNVSMSAIQMNPGLDTLLTESATSMRGDPQSLRLEDVFLYLVQVQFLVDAMPQNLQLKCEPTRNGALLLCTCTARFASSYRFRRASDYLPNLLLCQLFMQKGLVVLQQVTYSGYRVMVAIMRWLQILCHHSYCNIKVE